MKAAVLLATAAHAAKQAVEEPAESPVAYVPVSHYIRLRAAVARAGGQPRSASIEPPRPPGPRRVDRRRGGPQNCAARVWRRDRIHTHRFLIDPVKEMVAKGIETATTGAGWLKGGPQMVSDVVCGVVDTWVSVIDPNEGTIRKAMSGDAATLDELASLASTIGSIVFVVYVCMTAVNLFLATAESVRDYFKNYLTIPKLSKAVPVRLCA